MNRTLEFKSNIELCLLSGLIVGPPVFFACLTSSLAVMFPVLLSGDLCTILSALATTMTFALFASFIPMALMVAGVIFGEKKVVLSSQPDQSRV